MPTSTTLGPLTGNREMFASLVAAGSNYSDAYREAFDAAGMTLATLYKEASWLVRVPQQRAPLMCPRPSGRRPEAAREGG
ncbi:MAG: hypothetical protein ACKVT1_05510 [Dehalococcoidia bacterium]